MPHSISFWGSRTGKMNLILFLGTFLLFAPHPLDAQESNSPAISAVLITNLAQFWALPADEKKLVHHAHFNLLVYYCDPHWNVYWGRSDGLDTFLPLRGMPRELKAGQEADFDGLIIPVSEEFIWDKTSIKVLSESNNIPVVFPTGNVSESTNLNSH